VLWDRETHKIVSTNFPDITIDLGTRFGTWAAPSSPDRWGRGHLGWGGRGRCGQPVSLVSRAGPSGTPRPVHALHPGPA
jgi:hypothetical protein